MHLHRRITALLSLAVYLLAGVGAGMHLGHRHAPHTPVLCNDAERTASPVGEDGHSCCGHHHHGETATARCSTQQRAPGEGDCSDTSCPTCPDDHNAEDCHACQFLAQKPVAPAVVVLAGFAETIRERRPETTPRPDASPPALPFSRAPPVHA